MGVILIGEPRLSKRSSSLALIIRVLGSDIHASLTLRAHHVATVPTSLSIALCLRCNPEAAAGVASRELAPGHPACWYAYGACDMGHGDFSLGSGPVLVCVYSYVLVRVEFGIAILRATVLRTPSTGLHCSFKIRLSKCRGPVSTHLLYVSMAPIFQDLIVRLVGQTEQLSRLTTAVPVRHNLDSAMPGADIYIWLLWLALFLSDLHLLPTGHLLVSLKPTANYTGLPLYALPLDPHGQRQAAL